VISTCSITRGQHRDLDELDHPGDAITPAIG